MSKSYAVVAAIAVVFLVSVCAHAQTVDYDLYWVDDTSDQIWGYPDTTGYILNPSPSFLGVTCMAISQGGEVLLGAEFNGIARFDPQATTVDILDPYAYNVGELCEDGETGDIFWISGSGYTELWVLPSMGASSTVGHIFTDPPLDVEVIPNGAHAGNLLVLLGSYGADPKLVEVERTGQFSFAVVDTIYTAWETSPLAFSFMPDGTVIVLDSVDGMYIVDLDDGYLGQFGIYEDDSLEDISVGADGTVYVVDSAYDRVLRFDPSGSLNTPSLFGPLHSGAIEAVGFTPTPPGSNVPVNPAQNIDVLFEEVTDGGYTTTTATESNSRTSPGGNDLPAYVDPPGSRSDFTYIAATTSAAYENLIQVDIYLPGSRFFVAQGTGGEFHDVTVVGSIEDARGVISRFDSPIEVPMGGSYRTDGPTEFVLGEDTRPVTEVVDAKFERLIEILTDGEHSPSHTMDLVYARRYLLRRAERAEALYEATNPLGAIAELALMNSNVRTFAGKAIPNSSEDELGNVAGEILSRSKTLMFSLGLMVGPTRDASVGGMDAALALMAPNPVRGECRMHLSGPEGARAVAAIYSVSGRLVTTLFDGELKAGSHELAWDGRDDSGNRVSSGVYLTRAVAGAEVTTGRFVFIR